MMDFMHLDIPLYLLWVLVSVTLAWALRRWWKSEPRWELRLWRNRLAFVAFSLSGLSVALWFALVIGALDGGGIPALDPTLQGCYIVGKFLGLSGIVFALLGNGKLRWPACLISFVMVFMWLEASAFE
jgi:hypothetical protein